MKKINWLGIYNIVIFAVIFSIIGMSLPETIARLNANNLAYGTFASYVVSLLLFYLFIKDVRVIKDE